MCSGLLGMLCYVQNVISCLKDAACISAKKGKVSGKCPIRL